MYQVSGMRRNLTEHGSFSLLGAGMNASVRLPSRVLDAMATETMQTCGEPGDIVEIMQSMLPPEAEPARAPCSIALPALEEDIWRTCPACMEGVEGQLAHMEPGGCLASVV